MINLNREMMKLPLWILPEMMELPTNGAEIISINIKSKSHDSSGVYYMLRGKVLPIDPIAPMIHFQVNLPENWNGKCLQYGGGGFDGILVEATGMYVGQPINSTPPVEEGYVTFGCDGGHTAKGNWDEQWAFNDESLRNFAFESSKKTYDAAMALIFMMYGQKAARVYFAGGSNGGREALKAIQLWPQDYDGAIICYPVLNWIGKAIADSQNADYLCANKKRWIGYDDFQSMTKVLHEYHGIKDTQNEFITTIDLSEQQIKEIQKKTVTILTDDQWDTIRHFSSSKYFSYSLANGFKEMPGYQVLSGEPIVDRMVTQFGDSPGMRNGEMAKFGDAVIRGQIMRDMSFDPTCFHHERWKDKVLAASSLLDATDTDLSEFRERGGKLLLLHGLYDQLVTPKGSINYYKELEGRFGARELRMFAKLYLIPGYGHGMGEHFTMGADTLSILDHWVEADIEPYEIEVMDQNEKTFGRVQTLKPW